MNKKSLSCEIDYPIALSDKYIECLVRPYAIDFLKETSNHYTIYLYTASYEYYGQKIF